MREHLVDLFFRGADAPHPLMLAILAIAGLVASYVAWQRLSEALWMETAVSVAVAVLAAAEIAVVVKSGVSRFDRLAVIAITLMAASLIAEDIRSGGRAAGAWRGLRSSLRI